MIDHDYYNRLSEKEKEWLANFDDMYYTGNKEAYEYIYGVLPKKGDLTKSYERNNKRNRDITGVCAFPHTIESTEFLKAKNYIEEADKWEELEADLVGVEDEYED